YREFYQAGVELVGLDQPEAEVEVIAMAIEGLRALGLERFQIDLGHPDFFRGLLDEAKTDAAQGRELRATLVRKDGSTLERLVAELAPPAHVRDALLALPTLFGREAVLERAAAFARNERSSRALANLSEVYRLLNLGASVARDIISRGLEESIAYARAQRVGQALVIGHPRAGAGEVVAMNLADGSERVLAVGEILEHPERVFWGGSHA